MTVVESEFLRAALRYAERGRKVLPLEPNGKRPLWGLGWEDASSDPVQITAWWEREPLANVGIACTDGLTPLDVDGDEGEATLEELLAEHGGFAERTLACLTGRGRHLYFHHDGPLDGWRFGGLELKAHGYVVAPPSAHPSGRRYHYPEPDLEPAELPPWLDHSPRPVPVVAPAPATAPLGASSRLSAAGDAALRGELAKLSMHSAEAGSGRHTALFSAAAALGAHVAAGSLPESVVRRELTAAALWLQLPLDAETLHQIENGLAEGAKEPYQLRERPAPQNGRPAAGGGYVVDPGGPVESPGRGRLRVRALSTLTMRRVEWAWDQRVPLGKLSVLAGLPGQGKSLLTCWLASRVSRGELPGGLEGRAVPVLLVSAEDDPEDTIMPRVLRTGGDEALVHIVDVREAAQEGVKDYTRAVALPGDVPLILDGLEQTGAGLVVLDPIGGLLDSDHDGYKAQHVRAALGPLKAAAEERHAAVVLVQHILTKGQGTDPLSRLADSHAYAAFPRSIMALGPDPEDEDGDRGRSKVLYVVKSNLADRGQHGLRFQVEPGELVSDSRGGIGWSASVELVGEVENADAADSLASSEDRSALREAMTFLREFLADGPKPSAEVVAEAMTLGISERTLKRARAKVCGRATKSADGPWTVGLLGTLGPLGTVGTLGEGPGTDKSAKDAKGATMPGVVIQFRLDSDPDSEPGGVNYGSPPPDPGPEPETPEETT